MLCVSGVFFWDLGEKKVQFTEVEYGTWGQLFLKREFWFLGDVLIFFVLFFGVQRWAVFGWTVVEANNLLRRQWRWKRVLERAVRCG